MPTSTSAAKREQPTAISPSTSLPLRAKGPLSAETTAKNFESVADAGGRVASPHNKNNSINNLISPANTATQRARGTNNGDSSIDTDINEPYRHHRRPSSSRPLTASDLTNSKLRLSSASSSSPKGVVRVGSRVGEETLTSPTATTTAKTAKHGPNNYYYPACSENEIDDEIDAVLCNEHGLESLLCVYEALGRPNNTERDNVRVDNDANRRMIHLSHASTQGTRVHSPFAQFEGVARAGEKNRGSFVVVERSSALEEAQGNSLFAQTADQHNRSGRSPPCDTKGQSPANRFSSTAPTQIPLVLNHRTPSSSSPARHQFSPYPSKKNPTSVSQQPKPTQSPPPLSSTRGAPQTDLPNNNDGNRSPAAISTKNNNNNSIMKKNTPTLSREEGSHSPYAQHLQSRGSLGPASQPDKSSLQENMYISGFEEEGQYNTFVSPLRLILEVSLRETLARFNALNSVTTTTSVTERLPPPPSISTLATPFLGIDNTSTSIEGGAGTTNYLLKAKMAAGASTAGAHSSKMASSSSSPPRSSRRGEENTNTNTKESDPCSPPPERGGKISSSSSMGGTLYPTPESAVTAITQWYRLMQYKQSLQRRKEVANARTNATKRHGAARAIQQWWVEAVQRRIARADRTAFLAEYLDVTLPREEAALTIQHWARARWARSVTAAAHQAHRKGQLQLGSLLSGEQLWQERAYAVSAYIKKALEGRLVWRREMRRLGAEREARRRTDRVSLFSQQTLPLHDYSDEHNTNNKQTLYPYQQTIREDMGAFIEVEFAALRIQLWARALRAKKDAKKLIEAKAAVELTTKRRDAALAICRFQKVVARFIRRREAQEREAIAQKLQCDNAMATRIQSFFRMAKVRSRYTKERDLRETSAITLQKAVRKFNARQLRAMLEEGKITEEARKRLIELIVGVQSAVRGFLTRIKQRRAANEMRLSLTAQRVGRGYFAREAACRERAVMVIQRSYRLYAKRKAFLVYLAEKQEARDALHKYYAAVTIQRSWRKRQFRTEIEDRMWERQLREKAARRIQHAARPLIARGQLQTLKAERDSRAFDRKCYSAATLMAATYRGYDQHRRYRRIREILNQCSSLIARVVKGYWCRRFVVCAEHQRSTLERAARVIQKGFTDSKTKRAQKDRLAARRAMALETRAREEAALVLQRNVRMWQQKAQYLKTCRQRRLAVVLLQTFVRGKLSQDLVSAKALRRTQHRAAFIIQRVWVRNCRKLAQIRAIREMEAKLASLAFVKLLQHEENSRKSLIDEVNLEFRAAREGFVLIRKEIMRRNVIREERWLLRSPLAVQEDAILTVQRMVRGFVARRRWAKRPSPKERANIVDLLSREGHSADSAKASSATQPNLQLQSQHEEKVDRCPLKPLAMEMRRTTAMVKELRAARSFGGADGGGEWKRANVSKKAPNHHDKHYDDSTAVAKGRNDVVEDGNDESESYSAASPSPSPSHTSLLPTTLEEWLSWLTYCKPSFLANNGSIRAVERLLQREVSSRRRLVINVEAMLFQLYGELNLLLEAEGLEPHTVLPLSFPYSPQGQAANSLEASEFVKAAYPQRASDIPFVASKEGPTPTQKESQSSPSASRPHTPTPLLPLPSSSAFEHTSTKSLPPLQQQPAVASSSSLTGALAVAQGGGQRSLGQLQSSSLLRSRPVSPTPAMMTIHSVESNTAASNWMSVERARRTRQQSINDDVDTSVRVPSQPHTALALTSTSGSVATSTNTASLPTTATTTASVVLLPPILQRIAPTAHEGKHRAIPKDTDDCRGHVITNTNKSADSRNTASRGNYAHTEEKEKELEGEPLFPAVSSRPSSAYEGNSARIRDNNMHGHDGGGGGGERVDEALSGFVIVDTPAAVTAASHLTTTTKAQRARLTEVLTRLSEVYAVATSSNLVDSNNTIMAVDIDLENLGLSEAEVRTVLDRLKSNRAASSIRVRKLMLGGNTLRDSICSDIAAALVVGSSSSVNRRSNIIESSSGFDGTVTANRGASRSIISTSNTSTTNSSSSRNGTVMSSPTLSSTITHLSVANTLISDNGASQLAFAIAQCPSLVSVDLEGTNVSSSYRSHIRQMLVHRAQLIGGLSTVIGSGSDGRWSSRNSSSAAQKGGDNTLKNNGNVKRDSSDSNVVVVVGGAESRSKYAAAVNTVVHGAPNGTEGPSNVLNKSMSNIKRKERNDEDGEGFSVEVDGITGEVRDFSLDHDDHTMLPLTLKPLPHKFSVVAMREMVAAASSATSAAEVLRASEDPYREDGNDVFVSGRASGSAGARATSRSRAARVQHAAKQQQHDTLYAPEIIPRVA